MSHLKILTVHTSGPIGENEIFPEDLGLPKPTRENTIADISDLVTRPTRTCIQESLNLTIDTHQNKNLKLVDHDNNTKIRALFTKMCF